MKKSLGFTLAEVLITLGIIGVVAAMTMPTLMNSTQGAQYKAAYKKALSALSQAITLNVALNEIDFGDLDGSTYSASNDYNLENILRTRMNVVRSTSEDPLATGEYTPVAGIDGSLHGVGGTTLASNTTLFMNDGIMFSFTPGAAKNCTEDKTVATTAAKCNGFIDVNGTKGPNKVVACDTNNTATCVVSNPTDIYPVKFFDTSVVPSTEAAKAVLYGK